MIVAHDFHSPRGLALRERQTLVYLAAANGPLPKPLPAVPQLFDLDLRVKIDTTLLFRYSALTFNGHRIHYDLPYAKTVEHYDERVIHRPLQATLLWNIAAELHGLAPRHFEFRGVSPAVGPQVMRFGARASNYGAELMALDQADAITMTATAAWWRIGHSSLRCLCQPTDPTASQRPSAAGTMPSLSIWKTRCRPQRKTGPATAFPLIWPIARCPSGCGSTLVTPFGGSKTLKPPAPCRLRA